MLDFRSPHPELLVRDAGAYMFYHRPDADDEPQKPKGVGGQLSLSIFPCADAPGEDCLSSPGGVACYSRGKPLWHRLSGEFGGACGLFMGVCKLLWYGGDWAGID